MCIRCSSFWDTYRRGRHRKRQMYLSFPIQAGSAPLVPLSRSIQIANLRYTISAYREPPMIQFNQIQSNLSVNHSESAVLFKAFRLFCVQVLSIFSLLPITNRNKKNLFICMQKCFSAGNKSSAFESELYPLRIFDYRNIQAEVKLFINFHLYIQSKAFS